MCRDVGEFSVRGLSELRATRRIWCEVEGVYLNGF